MTSSTAALEFIPLSQCQRPLGSTSSAAEHGCIVARAAPVRCHRQETLALAPALALGTERTDESLAQNARRWRLGPVPASSHCSATTLLPLEPPGTRHVSSWRCGASTTRYVSVSFHQRDDDLGPVAVASAMRIAPHWAPDAVAPEMALVGMAPRDSGATAAASSRHQSAPWCRCRTTASYQGSIFGAIRSASPHPS